jgi:hypothetical protein
MTTLTEIDRNQVAALIEEYSEDSLLYMLIGSYEQRGAKADRLTGNILAEFATDLRACVRRRDESSQLAAYRLDWKEEDWLAWLDAASEREGLSLRTQRIEALRKSGCPEHRCAKVAGEFSRLTGAERRLNSPGRVPQTDVQLGVRLTLTTGLAGAKNVGDIAYWIIEQGWSGTVPEAVLWLRNHREGLPEQLQRFVPATPAASTATSSPVADPDDESVFDLNNGGK